MWTKIEDTLKTCTSTNANTWDGANTNTNLDENTWDKANKKIHILEIKQIKIQILEMEQVATRTGHPRLGEVSAGAGDWFILGDCQFWYFAQHQTIFWWKV